MQPTVMRSLGGGPPFPSTVRDTIIGAAAAAVESTNRRRVIGDAFMGNWVWVFGDTHFTNADRLQLERGPRTVAEPTTNAG